MNFLRGRHDGRCQLECEVGGPLSTLRITMGLYHQHKNQSHPSRLSTPNPRAAAASPVRPSLFLPPAISPVVRRRGAVPSWTCMSRFFFFGVLVVLFSVVATGGSVRRDVDIRPECRLNKVMVGFFSSQFFDEGLDMFFPLVESFFWPLVIPLAATDFLFRPPLVMANCGVGCYGLFNHQKIQLMCFRRLYSLEWLGLQRLFYGLHIVESCVGENRVQIQFCSMAMEFSEAVDGAGCKKNKRQRTSGRLQCNFILC